MTAGESAKAEPTVIKVGEGRKRLTKDSLKELAARIRGASGANNPDTKSIWVLYDEPTLIWIAEELERRGEASPPAAERTASKEVVKASVLNERLDRFRKAMFEKFVAVEHKHRGNSVTDDSLDWLTYDWSQIEAHFWEEIDEVRGAMRHGSSLMQMKELVDVANMAFLLWWHEERFAISAGEIDASEGTKSE